MKISFFLPWLMHLHSEISLIHSSFSLNYGYSWRAQVSKCQEILTFFCSPKAFILSWHQNVFRLLRCFPKETYLFLKYIYSFLFGSKIWIKNTKMQPEQTQLIFIVNGMQTRKEIKIKPMGWNRRCIESFFGGFFLPVSILSWVFPDVKEKKPFLKFLFVRSLALRHC